MEKICLPLKLDYVEHKTLRDTLKEDTSQLRKAMEVVYDENLEIEPLASFMDVMHEIFHGRRTKTYYQKYSHWKDVISSAHKQYLDLQKKLEAKREREIEAQIKVEKLAAILATERIKIGDTHTAIVMLQLTTRALGQIHNSFSNMMSYWEEQVIKCNELVQIAQNFSNINHKSDSVKKIRLKPGIAHYKTYST